MTPSRKVVIGFGRFNPPTTGHAEHIKFIANTAHRLGADQIVYASASQDRERNPLPFAVKVEWLHRLFPQVTFNKNQNIRTPFDAFKQCSELGYTHIFVVVSGERVPEFKRFERYFALPNSPQFKKELSIPAEYTVVDSGRSMDTGARMSATKLRGFAKKGDFESFREGVPTTDKRLAQLLYKDVRKFMGIHEKFQITEGQFKVGVFEAHDEILKPGTTVRVSYKGHRATGKVVRYDKGDGPHGTPYYVVDVGGQHHDPHAMHRSEKFPVHAVVKEDHIKVGDKVHAGLAQHGGAGFAGHVDKIEGNYVYVNIGKDKFGDRIIKAPMKNVMKESDESETQVDEAETPSATKPPSETERLRSTQQQELIALKARQANSMMAAKLRDVQMKAREAQAKANQPKPAAKPAS
jgi:hypothetical protein